MIVTISTNIGETICKFFKDNLIQFIIVIIVLVGTYIINRVINKQKRKREQFDVYITEFKEPFEKALIELKSGNQAAGTVKGFTKQHITVQSIFRDKLVATKSKRIVKRFDGFWDEYTCKDKNINQNEYFRCYLDMTNTTEGEKTMNEKAQKNIKSILNFVNEL